MQFVLRNASPLSSEVGKLKSNKLQLEQNLYTLDSPLGQGVFLEVATLQW